MRIAHAFKRGIAIEGNPVPKGRLNQSHLPAVQPSLRDLCRRKSPPGSELPGYFQISLREKGSAASKCPKSRFAVRAGKKVTHVVALRVQVSIRARVGK